MIPKQISYDRLKPIGYPTTLKIVNFQPMNNSSDINPTDIVRFQMNTTGFLDPWATYINLEVSVVDTDLGTDEILQIDHSAHSFISELIITHKGVEIERIQEYDVLSSFLADVNYNNEVRKYKSLEGFGCESDHFATGKNNSGKSSFYNTIPYTVANHLSTTTAQKKMPIGSKPWLLGSYSAESTADLQEVYADRIDPSTIGYNIANNFMSINFGNASVNQLGPLGANLASSTAFSGIDGLFNQDLSDGCFEPQFAKTLSQAPITFNSGKLARVVPQIRRFSLPMQSSIFGILMPKESYRFVPMDIFADILLEFRLNPYAMFTSGYKNQKNLTSSQTPDTYAQIVRKWKITKFEICAEILYFDQALTNMVLDQMNSESGCLFHTASWMLVNQYNIPKGLTPSGNYLIQMGFESLKNFVVLFLNNTYQNKSYVRKLNRYTGSITSLQLRLGLDLYPSLPLSGQSGTPFYYTSDDKFKSNDQFLTSLYKAFGKYNNSESNCSITPINFAINEDQWDYNDLNPAWTTSTSLPMGVSGNKLLNTNTAFTFPLLHNNRCKGKALFVLNLEGLDEEPGVISGLNTIKNRPFEIIIGSDTNYPPQNLNNTTFDYTMQFWAHYDTIIQIKKFNCVVLGRG